MGGYYYEMFLNCSNLSSVTCLSTANITMVVMPFSFSISDGILIGMISHVLLNAFCGNFRDITPTMWVLAILFVLRYIFI